MKIKKFKFENNKATDFIYLIVLFIYAIVMVLNDSNFSKSAGFDNTMKLLKYIVFGFAIVYFVLSYKKIIINKHVFIIFASLIGLNLVSFIFSGVEINILLILLMALASTHTKLRNITRTYLLGYVIGCCIVFYSSSIGIIEDVINNRYSDDIFSSFFLNSNYYTRHSFGFIFSNQVPFALMTVYFLLILWKQNKLSWIFHTIVEVLNVYTFIYCGSRFVFVIILLTTAIYIILRVTDKANWHLPRWNAYVFIILTAFSLALILFYNKVPYAFNVFLNFRISNAYKVIRTYGLHLIKSNFVAGTDNGVYGTIIDNGYLMLFMQRGILFGSTVLAMWTHISNIIIRNNRKYIFLILMLLALENFIDYQIISYKFLPLLCIALHENDDLVSKTVN